MKKSVDMYGDKVLLLHTVFHLKSESEVTKCGGIAQLARASGSYPEGRRFDPFSRYQSWALSSAGRASALQAGGHRFEPYSAHQLSGLSGYF